MSSVFMVFGSDGNCCQKSYLYVRTCKPERPRCHQKQRQVVWCATQHTLAQQANSVPVCHSLQNSSTQVLSNCTKSRHHQISLKEYAAVSLNCIYKQHHRYCSRLNIYELGRKIYGPSFLQKETFQDAFIVFSINTV